MQPLGTDKASLIFIFEQKSITLQREMVAAAIKRSRRLKRESRENRLQYPLL